MKIDSSAIALGCANLPEADLPELIEVAARHGFRRISARPYTFAKALNDGMTEQELQRQLTDAGIEVTVMDGLIRSLPGAADLASLDPALRAVLTPDAISPLDEATCFRSAEVLGASIVNVPSAFCHAAPLDQTAEAVRGMCRRAAGRGLRISLEFVPNTGLPDLAFTQAVLQACGEPNCAIMLDVFHLDRSGGTVDDVRRLPPEAIAGIHLSDRVPPPPGSRYEPQRGRLLPGEGQLPLGELVEAALNNSPRAYLEIEVLNHELAALPPDDVAGRLAAAARRWVASL
jgi:sugar phosphate isomerase/epimerase